MRKNPQIIRKKDTLTANDRLLRELTLDDLSENLALLKMPEPVEGRFFNVPPGEYYLFFLDEPQRVKTIADRFPMFPPFGFSAFRLGFRSSPIKDIWKKGRNSDGMIGIVRFYVRDEFVFIDMMSVKPGYKHNHVNTFMMRAIQDQFPNKELCFSDPTEPGKKFIQKFGGKIMLYEEFDPWEQ